MIELKEVVTKYPECLASPEKFRNFMIDLYPSLEERAAIRVLTDILANGFVDEIQNGKNASTDISRYVRGLSINYGYDTNLINECISQWIDTFAEDCVGDTNDSVLSIEELRESYPDFDISDDGCLERYTGTDEVVVIPKGITSIGYRAFTGCKSLTSITIPESVTSIGDRAFSGCKSLINITIPESVTSIGYEAFERCKNLTSITIPDSVTSIGDRAFRGCENLTSITIPDRVTSIGYEAFRGCKSLSSIIIPDGVTSIGYKAFERCKNLTSITIPDSVTTIGDSAFKGCIGLASSEQNNKDADIPMSDWEYLKELRRITKQVDEEYKQQHPDEKMLEDVVKENLLKYLLIGVLPSVLLILLNQNTINLISYMIYLMPAFLALPLLFLDSDE